MTRRFLTLFLKKDDMILGIGSDLVNIRRIEALLLEYGLRFVLRVFTEEERARAEKSPDPAAVYAKRWAAKEACSKALGHGLNKGVFFKDMGIVNLSSGQPTMILTGGAARALEKMTPAGMKAVIHVTLSDDYPMAQAFVVISGQ